MGRRSLAEQIFNEYKEEEPGEDTWLIIHKSPRELAAERDALQDELRDLQKAGDWRPLASLIKDLKAAGAKWGEENE